MAKIVFLIDAVFSHFFATTGLANDLIEKDHEVAYLGIPDIKNEVAKHGYDFHTIFARVYPPGSVKYNSKDRDNISFVKHMKIVAEGGLDSIIETLSPDLLIIGYFLSLEAVFLNYLYDNPQVIFTSFLRREEETPLTYALNQISMMSGEISDCIIEFIVKHQLQVSSSLDFVKPLDNMKELIECPKELDFTGVNRSSNVYYNFSANFDTGAADDFLKNVPRGKKIVFLSMGSMIFHYYKKSLNIYKKFLDCMRLYKLTGIHLIVSLGKYIKKHELGEIPGNVSLFDWVPQTKLLQSTDLIITHAGLGTIKEALYWQVPIIASPFSKDQPYNASLIEFHKLGYVIDIEQVSLADLKAAVTGILTDDTVNKNVTRMSQIFRKKDEEKNGVKIIEAVIKQI